MKKTMALALTTCLLAALLAGCSQTPAESSTPETTSSAAESQPEETPAESTPEEEAPAEEPAAEESEEEPSEYVPGERTDTDYTNTTLGLHFALPETMVMASDEEIQNMMQAGSEMMYEDPETGEKMLDYAQLTTVYEMVAADVTNGSNVMVASEKLTLSGMTEDQYFAALEQQLAQTTVTVDFGETEQIPLGNTTFTGMTYSVQNGEITATQTMLLKKVGDRMYMVNFSYTDPAQYETLLSCFTPLEAV